MKKEFKRINYFLIAGIMFFFITSIAILVDEEHTKQNLINKNKILQNESELYKTILKANSEFSKVSLDNQKASSYYDEASYFYENQEYKLVESNCRLARDYYSKESQGYKNIKAKLLSSEIKDNLIDIYVNSLNSASEISDNMYEACEHFESAVRYYDKYYNTKVSYDDTSYYMGTAEIENMNEKIKAHDKAVEEYNQYLEDFKVELEGRLE